MSGRWRSSVFFAAASVPAGHRSKSCALSGSPSPAALLALQGAASVRFWQARGLEPVGCRRARRNSISSRLGAGELARGWRAWAGGCQVAGPTIAAPDQGVQFH